VLYVLIQGDDKVVKLLVQLKLHASVKNSFEYFTVHIPIFNRYMHILLLEVLRILFYFSEVLLKVLTI